jgi:hypothetical protein
MILKNLLGNIHLVVGKCLFLDGTLCDVLNELHMI